MDDNKNLIIAVALMLAVWIGFSFFFPSSRPVAEPQAVPANTAVVVPPAAEKLSTQQTSAVLAAVPLVTTERQIQVETDHLRVVMTSSGARVQRVELKDYRITADPAAPSVVLFDSASPKFASLRLEGQGDFSFNPDIAFAVEGDESKISISGSSSQELVFRAVLPNGLTVERRYRFHGQSYGIELETRLINGSGRELHGQFGVVMTHPWDEHVAKSKPEFAGGYSLVADKIKTESPKDLRKGPVLYEQDLAWSGFKDNYFLSVLVPVEGKLKGELRATEMVLENRQISSVLSLQTAAVIQQKHLVYFGPLDVDILKGLGFQLERAVDFGFFKLLAKPLFDVLRFFYSFLGNYGLAIILLTVIIKLLFWPLTQKSYSSMKAMQKLQPEMQKLREKYKNDRERMNREVMELYKNHRVNPLGGCLPMLVQIPVFFALYQVLMVSIELRQAPFYFWISDLSLKDPYYITPLVMGVTMFIQQKMTPVSGVDPIQAKIFLFLPVVFTVMFLNFPSGLVLYWLINNLLTILQQYLINRKPA